MVGRGNIKYVMRPSIFAINMPHPYVIYSFTLNKMSGFITYIFMISDVFQNK